MFMSLKDCILTDSPVGAIRCFTDVSWDGPVDSTLNVSKVSTLSGAVTKILPARRSP